MFIALIAFLLTIGILVFVHEAGHFFAARRAGMGVEEFGFGFPPRIVGFQRIAGRWRMAYRAPERMNGGPPTSTTYSVNWIPLGGFVRITGEDGDVVDDPRSFSAKPRWQRFLVLIAGVAMNVVLAVVLFTTVAAIGAPQIIDGTIPAGARVRDLAVRIVGVLDESPAAVAGVRSGDRLVAVDDTALTDLPAVQVAIRSAGEREVTLTVDREGEMREVRVRPTVLPGMSQVGIGVQLVQTGVVAFPFHRAVIHGVRTTGVVAVEVVRGFWGLFRGLVAERRLTVDVAGPVGIAVLTGQAVQLGPVYLVQFAGVLSVNLAFLNILPFPGLDGGRLFLLLVETVRRRALRRSVERLVHAVGFAVLLLIAIAVTYRDIRMFGRGVLGSIRDAIGF